ncbi:Hypothetical predicted protein [Olea europaea subsp. europaea]|uniref:Uncharacterized protein n=1 Tax=Olea europaea subsp. europaea TaxID=158383 RepID=A0A8S0Q1W9_OLEEU|nr:Hypothetical predicted protein [Olea europaea subsp. europaea]
MFAVIVHCCGGGHVWGEKSGCGGELTLLTDDRRRYWGRRRGGPDLEAALNLDADWIEEVWVEIVSAKLMELRSQPLQWPIQPMQIPKRLQRLIPKRKTAPHLDDEDDRILQAAKDADGRA